MPRLLLLLLLLPLALGCPPTEPGPADDDDDAGVWGQAALDYITEHLVGTYEGSWTIYGLSGADIPQEVASFTDTITASNPRIEGDRALTDVHDEMDGGSWTAERDFYEGLYILTDGSIGDYFYELDGDVTIMTETSTDVWEYEQELTANDYDAMQNVTADNVTLVWKRAVKLVTWTDGLQRHDVTATTHVEYDAGDGPQTVEFMSFQGYHQQME